MDNLYGAFLLFLDNKLLITHKLLYAIHYWNFYKTKVGRVFHRLRCYVVCSEAIV